LLLAENSPPAGRRTRLKGAPFWLRFIYTKTQSVKDSRRMRMPMPYRATLPVRSKRGCGPKAAFTTNIVESDFWHAQVLIASTIDRTHRYNRRKNSRSPFVKSTDRAPGLKHNQLASKRGTFSASRRLIDLKGETISLKRRRAARPLWPTLRDSYTGSNGRGVQHIQWSRYKLTENNGISIFGDPPN
jgi:hypothetical protein